MLSSPDRSSGAREEYEPMLVRVAASARREYTRDKNESRAAGSGVRAFRFAATIASCRFIPRSNRRRSSDSKKPVCRYASCIVGEAVVGLDGRMYRSGNAVNATLMRGRGFSSVIARRATGLTGVSLLLAPCSLFGGVRRGVFFCLPFLSPPL